MTASTMRLFAPAEQTGLTRGGRLSTIVGRFGSQIENLVTRRYIGDDVLSERSEQKFGKGVSLYANLATEVPRIL